MQFSIKSPVETLRLGTLSVKEAGRTLSVPTPGCILYTKSGCVPHLTHDTLKHSIFKEDNSTERASDGDDETRTDKLVLPMLFPLAQFISHRKNLSAASESKLVDEVKPRRGVIEFASLSREFDVIAFALQNDPSAPLPEGFNAGQFVALWNYSGKVEVTPDLAEEVTSSMAPHAAQILADCDVRFHQSRGHLKKKRLTKALKRSQTFVSRVGRLLEKEKNAEKDEVDSDNSSNEKAKTVWWATVFVGLESKDFQHYLDELPKENTGFILDGFLPAKDMKVVESSLHVDQVVEAVAELTSALPSSKPRFLPHVATPRLVIGAVEKGIDLFDTSFAVVASNRGGALVFRCDLEGVEGTDSNGTDSSAFNDTSSTSQLFVELDLNKTEFADDFSSLLPGCPCYSCKTHSRAYVHHLLVTQELLAQVLLMVHNQYHFTKFFDRLRRAIEIGKWNRFKDLILSHTHVIPEKAKDKRTGEDEGDDLRTKKKLVL